MTVIGRKIGMSRIFNNDGISLPVTVIEVEPNRVTQIKTIETDGYNAVQVTVGSKNSSRRLTKAISGHFAKAGTVAGRGLWELNAISVDKINTGDELTIDCFKIGQYVDITGKSKGKGFQGGVKRWNFHMQDATHGNSISHRALGSTGQCQTPGRVWKGKKMPGHMGSRRVTVQSLQVLRIDSKHNLLLVKGAVPGATGSDVIVQSAVKTHKKTSA